jgi:hypothetical protein
VGKSYGLVADITDANDNVHSVILAVSGSPVFTIYPTAHGYFSRPLSYRILDVLIKAAPEIDEDIQELGKMEYYIEEGVIHNRYGVVNLNQKRFVESQKK